MVTEEGLHETTVGKPGDIALVSRVNVGRVGVLNEKSAFNQDIKILRIRNYVTPEFVSKYLLSLKRHFRNLERGGTINGITKDHVKALKIPIPPKNQQKQILDQIEHKVDSFTDLQRSLALMSELLDEYKDSVLAYAFRGK